eukprot:COSAG02_NODE_1_length_108762_cov_456.708287_54_plen_154_part_00
MTHSSRAHSCDGWVYTLEIQMDPSLLRVLGHGPKAIIAISTVKMVKGALNPGPSYNTLASLPRAPPCGAPKRAASRALHHSPSRLSRSARRLLCAIQRTNTKSPCPRPPADRTKPVPFAPDQFDASERAPGHKAPYRLWRFPLLLSGNRHGRD